MKTNLLIYNSLYGKKEIFKPIIKGAVSMYVCGPTVYSNVHLGNCRTFISFDIIFRYLKHLGYKVRYVRNITDVGHLENDSDDGEDRISKKARIEQLEPMEIAQKYTVDFHKTLAQFNCLPPSIEPTATGHIIEQIEIIKQIEAKGLAYEINGSVYFDVIKFNQENNYGKLSKRDINQLIHNNRSLEKQSDKKNPQDFALWKKATPNHIMRWKSPWSEGFPGWHLECTAMSIKYLGTKFDIHGGGIDLKFPHHECEIAQAEAFNRKNPVNYWLHTNMLTLNGQKMAKSTGNNILPQEIFTGKNSLLSKKYSPSVVRFFILQAHYRNVLDISNKGLLAAEKGYNRLMESLEIVSQLSKKTITKGFDVKKWIENCYQSMNDDFNTPILIAQLFEAVKFINALKNGKHSISIEDFNLLNKNLKKFIFEVLGLEKQNKNNESDGIIEKKTEKLIQILIGVRKKARQEKNYAVADNIREQLIDIGIQIKDEEEKTNFYVK